MVRLLDWSGEMDFAPIGTGQSLRDSLADGNPFLTQQEPPPDPYDPYDLVDTWGQQGGYDSTAGYDPALDVPPVDYSQDPAWNFPQDIQALGPTFDAVGQQTDIPALPPLDMNGLPMLTGTPGTGSILAPPTPQEQQGWGGWQGWGDTQEQPTTDFANDPGWSTGPNDTYGQQGPVAPGYESNDPAGWGMEPALHTSATPEDWATPVGPLNPDWAVSDARQWGSDYQAPQDQAQSSGPMFQPLNYSTDPNLNFQPPDTSFKFYENPPELPVQGPLDMAQPLNPWAQGFTPSETVPALAGLQGPLNVDKPLTPYWQGFSPDMQHSDLSPEVLAQIARFPQGEAKPLTAEEFAAGQPQDNRNFFESLYDTATAPLDAGNALVHGHPLAAAQALGGAPLSAFDAVMAGLGAAGQAISPLDYAYYAPVGILTGGAYAGAENKNPYGSWGDYLDALKYGLSNPKEAADVAREQVMTGYGDLAKEAVPGTRFDPLAERLTQGVVAIAVNPATYAGGGVSALGKAAGLEGSLGGRAAVGLLDQGAPGRVFGATVGSQLGSELAADLGGGQRAQELGGLAGGFLGFKPELGTDLVRTGGGALDVLGQRVLPMPETFTGAEPIDILRYLRSPEDANTSLYSPLGVGTENIERLGNSEDIARGKQALLSRLELESRRAEPAYPGEGFDHISRLPNTEPLNRDAIAAGRSFIEALPEKYLENLGSSYIKGGATEDLAIAGQYLPEEALIRIVKSVTNQSADPERVIPHEVSHHLLQFVDDTDYDRLKKLYLKQLSGEGSRATTAIEDVLVKAESGQKLTGAEGQAMADTYRFRQGFGEWFAEVMADRAIRDSVIPELSPKGQGIITRGAQMVKDLAVSAYRTLTGQGYRTSADDVYRRLLAGEYEGAARTSEAGAMEAPEVEKSLLGKVGEEQGSVNPGVISAGLSDILGHATKALTSTEPFTHRTSGPLLNLAPLSELDARAVAQGGKTGMRGLTVNRGGLARRRTGIASVPEILTESSHNQVAARSVANLLSERVLKDYEEALPGRYKAKDGNIRIKGLAPSYQEVDAYFNAGKDAPEAALAVRVGEFPDQYPLTPEQKAAFARIRIPTDQVKDEILFRGGKVPQANLDIAENQQFFSRKALSGTDYREQVKFEPRRTGSSNLARVDTKPRIFNDPAEATAKGVVYADPADATVSYLHRGLNSAVNAHTADILTKYAVPVSDIPIDPVTSKSEVGHMRYPLVKGAIQVPHAAENATALKDLYFPKDDAEAITSHYRVNTPGPPFGNLEKISAKLRAANAFLVPVRATADFSSTFNQLGISAVNNPEIFTKNLGRSFVDAVSDREYAKFMAGDNVMKAAKAGVKIYSDTGPSSEFQFSNLQKYGEALKQAPVVGKLAEKAAPILGAPIRVAERHYNRFITRQRVDVFNATVDWNEAHGRPLDSQSQQQLAKALNRITGSGSGTPGTVRQITEFAPGFLSANVQNVYHALSDSSIEGQYARKALGTYFGFGTTVVGLTALAQGRDPADVLSPIDLQAFKETGQLRYNSNWGTIRAGNHDVQMFGQYGPLMRLTSLGLEAAHQVSADIHTGNADVKSLGPVAEALRQFYGTKGGPPIQFAVDTGAQLAGKNTFSNTPVFSPRGILEHTAPISLSQFLGDVWDTAHGKPGKDYTDDIIALAANVFGLRQNPLTSREVAIRDLAWADPFGKQQNPGTYLDLDPAQRKELRQSETSIFANNPNDPFQKSLEDARTRQAANQMDFESGKQGANTAKEFRDKRKEANRDISDLLGNVLAERGAGQDTPPWKWTNAYYDTFASSKAADGSIDSDKLESAQAQFWASVADPASRIWDGVPKDQRDPAVVRKYIYRLTGVGDTGAEKQYHDDLIRMSGYDPESGKRLINTETGKPLEDFFKLRYQDRYPWNVLPNDVTKPLYDAATVARQNESEAIQKLPVKDYVRAWVAHNTDYKDGSPEMKDILDYGNEKRQDPRYLYYAAKYPWVNWLTEPDYTWESIQKHSAQSYESLGVSVK